MKTDSKKTAEKEPADKKAPKKTFNIEVFTAWCKKCHICVTFCPQEALEAGKDGHPKLKQPNRCIGCGWCEVRCPDFAIDVVEKKVDK